MTDHPTPPPAAQTREEGWHWVKTLKDTKRDFWSPAYFTHNDKPSGTIGYWLDSWLDGIVEPTEIGPRIPTPAERAGDAALGERLRRIVFDALMERDVRADGEAGMEIDDETDLIVNSLHNAGVLAALTPAAPGTGTGWNEAIEAAEAAVLALVHPNNRHHLMQELRAGSVLAAIRALRKPSPPGAAEEDGL